MMMPNWPLAICFSLSSSARMHWWTVCQHSPNRNANGNTAILHICPSTMCFSSLQSVTFSGGLFLLAEWGSERALRQRDPFLASSSTQIAFLATIGNLASPIANMVMGWSMRIGMRIRPMRITAVIGGDVGAGFTRATRMLNNSENWSPNQLNFLLDFY